LRRGDGAGAARVPVQLERSAPEPVAALAGDRELHRRTAGGCRALRRRGRRQAARLVLQPRAAGRLSCGRRRRAPRHRGDGRGAAPGAAVLADDAEGGAPVRRSGAARALRRCIAKGGLGRLITKARPGPPGTHNKGRHDMTGTSRQKIAILGGGIAGLTTAFELTSQPGWEQKYEITLYQLGWRLGGKCATGRGPNGRIQEHGIHGFLGCYYNALPLMRECYEALGRKPDQPLATFDDAFKPESFVLMWEFIDNNWRRWPFTAPTNDLSPADPSSLGKVEDWVSALIGFVKRIFEDNIEK